MGSDGDNRQDAFEIEDGQSESLEAMDAESAIELCKLGSLARDLEFDGRVLTFAVNYKDLELVTNIASVGQKQWDRCIFIIDKKEFHILSLSRHASTLVFCPNSGLVEAIPDQGIAFEVEPHISDALHGIVERSNYPIFFELDVNKGDLRIYYKVHDHRQSKLKIEFDCHLNATKVDHVWLLWDKSLFDQHSDSYDLEPSTLLSAIAFAAASRSRNKSKNRYALSIEPDRVACGHSDMVSMIQGRGFGSETFFLDHQNLPTIIRLIGHLRGTETAKIRYLDDSVALTNGRFSCRFDKALLGRKMPELKRDVSASVTLDGQRLFDVAIVMSVLQQSSSTGDAELKISVYGSHERPHVIFASPILQKERHGRNKAWAEASIERQEGQADWEISIDPRDFKQALAAFPDCSAKTLSFSPAALWIEQEHEGAWWRAVLAKKAPVAKSKPYGGFRGSA